jgi:NADH dehydrogenase FAD-containing subunit
MERAARIVIVGGGVAALEAALALRGLLGSEPAITMVAPNEDFVYQPLSVAEPFALGATPHLPLREFAEDIDVEWQQANLESGSRRTSRPLARAARCCSRAAASWRTTS